MTPEIALALARKRYNGRGLQDADIEDIASSALLANWQAYTRTGNLNHTSFFYDLMDAWRTYTGCRNKHAKVLLVASFRDDTKPYRSPSGVSNAEHNRRTRARKKAKKDASGYLTEVSPRISCNKPDDKEGCS